MKIKTGKGKRGSDGELIVVIFIIGMVGFISWHLVSGWAQFLYWLSPVK